jgi:hypothetical protein
MLKRPFQGYDLVEVIWNDASELTSGWTDEIEKDEPALALSVGFLVRETKEHIIIAQDIDEQGHHNGRSQIPRGMVKKLKVLRKKDNKKADGA